MYIIQKVILRNWLLVLIMFNKKINIAKYQPASSSNPINIGLTFIICLILSVFYGWLYSLTTLIPIIYFNWIITIGFGFVMAISLQIIAKLLKIRERKLRIYLIVFSLIIAYYSHWVTYILYLGLQKFPNFFEFFNYWIYPHYFFSNISELNNIGAWSIGVSGLFVKGYILTIIWILEALIIFFIGITYIKKFPENPFSEMLNKWYPKYPLDYSFAAIYSKNKIISDLEESGIDIIFNMDKGLANKYTSISIFYLKGENKQYLSIDTINIGTNNNSQKKSTVILEPFEIKTFEANSLISKFGTKKEFFLDY